MAFSQKTELLLKLVLYPSYPLRNSNDLHKTIQVFKSKGYKIPLVRLKTPKTHPYLCYERDDKENVKSVMNNDANMFCIRQQYPKYSELTHWACIVPVNYISKLNAQLIYPGGFGCVIPDDISYIDSEMDIEFAEFLMKKHQHDL